MQAFANSLLGLGSGRRVGVAALTCSLDIVWWARALPACFFLGLASVVGQGASCVFLSRFGPPASPGRAQAQASPCTDLGSCDVCASAHSGLCRDCGLLWAAFLHGRNTRRVWTMTALFVGQVTGTSDLNAQRSASLSIARDPLGGFVPWWFCALPVRVGILCLSRRAAQSAFRFLYLASCGAGRVAQMHTIGVRPPLVACVGFAHSYQYEGPQCRG